MLTLQTSINENIAVDTNIDGHGLWDKAFHVIFARILFIYFRTRTLQYAISVQ
jgi:hypothetical protein